jgi:hypothetical protein
MQICHHKPQKFSVSTHLKHFDGCETTNVINSWDKAAKIVGTFVVLSSKIFE